MSCLYLLFNLTNDITGWRWWLAGVQGASICRVGKSFCCFKLLYEPFISNSRINTLLQSHKFNFPSCFSRHSNESLDEFLESIQTTHFRSPRPPFRTQRVLTRQIAPTKPKLYFNGSLLLYSVSVVRITFLHESCVPIRAKYHVRESRVDIYFAPV